MGRFDFGMGWDGQRWREYFGIETPQQEEDLKKVIKSVLEEMETPLENNHAINHVQFIDLTGSPEYQVSYPLTDEELDSFISDNNIKVQVYMFHDISWYFIYHIIFLGATFGSICSCK